MVDSVVVEEQKQKLNEIEIPQEQARALGRALKQQFSPNLPSMQNTAKLLLEASRDQNPD